MPIALQIMAFLVMAILADIKVLISGKARIGNINAALRYNMVVFGVISVLFLAFLADGKLMATVTVITAMLYGVFTAAFQVLYILAMEKGPISILVLLINFSVVPTSVLGSLIFKESFKIAHLIGLVLVLLSFVLTVRLGGKKKDNLGYVYAVIALFLSSAGTLVQRYHQKTEFAYERNKFLCLAYMFAGFSVLLIALVMKAKGGNERVKLKRFFPAGVGVGIVLAAYQFLMIYLASKSPSMLMYPMISGMTLVINFLLCAIFFREKMNARQIVGATLGTAALVLMAI